MILLYKKKIMMINCLFVCLETGTMQGHPGNDLDGQASLTHELKLNFVKYKKKHATQRWTKSQYTRITSSKRVMQINRHLKWKTEFIMRSVWSALFRWKTEFIMRSVLSALRLQHSRDETAPCIPSTRQINRFNVMWMMKKLEKDCQKW